MWKVLVEFACAKCGTKHQHATELSVSHETCDDTFLPHHELEPKTLPDGWIWDPVQWGPVQWGHVCGGCANAAELRAEQLNAVGAPKR